MNQHAKMDVKHSTCPHDCPSACALDIEVIGGQTIGRVRGSKLQSYTAGVVCAKVARYAERIHHADRLMYPMRRTGPKGSGRFARISWDEAFDVHNSDTVKQADIRNILRPRTDGAFACGVMHVLCREGFSDRDYLERYTDCPDELEAHLKTRTPEWASAVCGVPVEEIEAFARAVGETKRTFFRLGYGFTRSRNGAAQMHAALCIPAVTGAWQYEGGGAFFNNYALWH